MKKIPVALGLMMACSVVPAMADNGQKNTPPTQPSQPSIPNSPPPKKDIPGKHKDKSSIQALFDKYFKL